ncbi:MAG: hypothetical protein K1060chlam1_01412, partial [Candidatus Anoxychlamydiales bacterium]|nr:hypothetical protein [Candidatus Anoxychlamydiales bacterium]
MVSLQNIKDRIGTALFNFSKQNTVGKFLENKVQLLSEKISKAFENLNSNRVSLKNRVIGMK